MKKIYTIAFILVVLITNAQVPSYVPTNGLVGYWPFNGNANDESGNGNNGTVNGATLTTDRFGNSNSAYSFSNNYISLSQAFFNGSTNVNALTYSVWFKCSQLPSSSTAYSLSNKEGYWRSIGLGINSSGLVSYGGSQPNPQSYFGVSSQNSIVLNQWNHIIITFENSTLKLYLNGNLENTSVINYSTLDYSYLAIGNSTSTNLIGASYPVSPGLTNFTKGIIDDFGVWNRALTQQEITNLYNASLPQTACLPANVPTNGLVGYWPFCGNANDESGNGNNGIVNGATLTTDRFGFANSAYSFDGVSNFIEVNSSNSINVTNSYTLSTWINVAKWSFLAPVDEHAVISKIDSGNWYGGYEIFTGGNDGTIAHSGNIGNSNILISNNNYNINNWYNVVVTYDGSALKMYVNGILVKSQPYTGNIQTSSYPLRFGRRGGAGFYNNWFNGKIDDVGIWNRALSQEEITNLYNASLPQTACLPANVPTNGLVGYWPFCGNANDESGNGNNGTVGNGINLANDRFGLSNSAYSLTGTSNISLKSIPTSGNSDFTITGWVKTNNQNLRKGIACWGQDTPWSSTYFFINSSGFLQFDFAYKSGPVSAIKITDDIWHFVSVTCKGGIIKLYVDGLQNGNSLQMFPNITGNNKSIGSNIDNSGQNNFIGLLDDVGIWNRALTQEEITSLYNTNQCITNITVTDTLIINVGQLSFNEPVTWANNITIFPNPASTQININFNNITNLNGGTLKIINSLGQQVATTPITTSGTNSTMQLATWGGSGMYFVQIINPQGQIVDIKKIILQ